MFAEEDSEDATMSCWYFFLAGNRRAQTFLSLMCRRNNIKD
jgi:hypothetical protein